MTQLNISQLRSPISVPLLAALCIGTLSFLMYVGLPIIMGAVADQHQFDEQQLGWIASADMAGLFFGSIVTSLLIGKVGLRKIGTLGISIAVVGNVMSMPADSVFLLGAARFVADFGGGVCHSLALACLARLSHPSRTYTLFMIAIVVVGSIWLFLLPSVTDRWGDDGVFAILMIAFIIPASLLRFIDDAETTNDALIDEATSSVIDAGTARSFPPLVGFVALAGVLFFNAGATSFWVFAERLGVSINLEPAFISLTFAICNILTLGGCWLAYRFGSTFGPFKPNFAVLLFSVMIFLLSMFNLFTWSYVALIFFFAQAWAMTGIFQWAILGDIDPTGRLVALALAAQGLGMSIGPTVSGSLLGYGLPMSSVGAVNATFMILTLLAFYFVYVFVKKHGYSHAPD